MKEDEILECLLTANDQYDPSCIIILQHIFTAWLNIVNVAAAEHMKGGRFEVITEELAAETSSMPSHNKFPESVFVFLDALTKFRPVASTDDVNYYGFWQYPDAVDEMLRFFKSPAEAKKAQIRFLNTILHQVVNDKELYQFREKGKDYSLDKLKLNVKSLIQLAL